MLRRYSEIVERRVEALDSSTQRDNKALTLLEDEADRAAYLAGFLWNRPGRLT